VVTLVVVENEAGEVVVGRRAIDPSYGAWCLPGGFVNDDEHPEAAAARECLEEIGAEVDITDLIGVYHISKEGAPSMVGIAYRARLRSGSVPVAGEEMLEIAVLPPARVPELAFSSHREAMRDWLRKGEGCRRAP
jgi:8-oxo-dGTP diphosphatase